MANTEEERIPFPTQYHITATCYLTRDGRWTACKEEAGVFESTELQYRFLGGCALERAEPKPDKQ